MTPNAGTEAAARVTTEALVSDMAAFKAANPGAPPTSTVPCTVLCYAVSRGPISQDSAWFVVVKDQTQELCMPVGACCAPLTLCMAG